jgi:hypothetical protein
MTWNVGMAGFYVRRAGTTARPAPGSAVAGEPRMSDAAAATRQAAMAKVNAAWRPSWNRPEIRFGKNDCPVSAARS